MVRGQRACRRFENVHRNFSEKLTKRENLEDLAVDGTAILTLRLLMSYIYIYIAPILDVSRSHTTTQHSR